MTPHEESLRRRAVRLNRLEGDEKGQALEYERCARDPVLWLSRWGWTADPRNASLGQPVNLPFEPFPRQIELLHWLLEREHRQESGIVEKSREVGVTWICAAYATHGWLFVPNYAVGFGSRIRELVDRLGDPDSILEKVRHLLYSLPRWMLPPHFDRRQHDNLARIVNPDNGSTIVGKGGDQMGRGGRYSVFFVDEAAHLERPLLVDSALSMATNVRIDVSTPHGQGNPFWQKRFSGKLPVFTFHWRQDPRKDQTWYEEKKRQLIDASLIAEQLEIDYSASLPDVAIPARWVRAAVGLRLPSSGPVIAGLDVGWEQGTTVFTPRRGPVVSMPIAWTGLDTTAGARRAVDEAERANCTLLCYDSCGVGMTYTAAFRAAERPLRFVPVGVNAGDHPTERVWPDGQTARQKFRNLRAEMWWGLRARFERTWEFVEQHIKHQAEDLISIPDCPELIAQLSLPTYYRMESGKVGVESKPDMKRRGVQSPDFADSLCLAFAPVSLPAPAVAGGERFTVVTSPGASPSGPPPFAAAGGFRPIWPRP